MLRAALAGFLVATMLVSAGCRKRDPPERHLKVEFSGCAAVGRGPVCEVDDDQVLRFVVERAEADRVTFRVGDDVLAPRRADAVESATRYEVVVPTGAQRILVAAEGSSRAKFDLQLIEHREPSVLARVKELRSKGESAAAADHLSKALDGCAEPDCSRIASELGRVELSRGQFERAVARLGGTARQHRDAGRLSEWVRDAQAVVFVLVTRLHRYAEARGQLKELETARDDVIEARVTVPYFQGLLAVSSGDLRTALRAFEDSERLAQRFGMNDHAHMAMQERANVLHLLGRRSEATTLLEDLRGVSADQSACERGRLLNNLGWFTLLSDEPGQRALELFEQADRILREGCAEPHKLANVATNLALANERVGNLDAAERYLAASRAFGAPATAQIGMWQLEIEGQVQLAQNHPLRALEHFDRELSIASELGSMSMVWRAQLSRAEALEGLNRTDEALKAYAAAEKQLDNEVLWAPLGEGRSLFLRDRERSARRRVDLLVRARRVEEGFRVARLARVRFLGELRALGSELLDDPARHRAWEQALTEYRMQRERLEAAMQGDWGLAEDEYAQRREKRSEDRARLRHALDDAFAALVEGGRTGRVSLRNPSPGEVVLMAHPVEDGWMAFAGTSQGTQARKLEAGEDVARGLLSAFANEIEGADRISIIPDGRLEQVDFHALEFHGKPLVVLAPVTYLVDAPGAGDSAASNLRRAAVFADPAGNLREAREEGATVQQILRERGVNVALMLGESVTRTALMDALPHVDLLHFAGHGSARGHDGWDGALSLSEGRLTVGEVVALGHVPTWVVLSGCETSRTAGTGAMGGLSLAHAFILAGARQAVATSVPVEDTMAQSIISELYRGLESNDFDLGDALRRAQVSWLEGGGGSGWSAFRALGR